MSRRKDTATDDELELTDDTLGPVDDERLERDDGPKPDTSPAVTLRCHCEGGKVTDVATTEAELAEDGVAVPNYTLRVQLPRDEA